MSIDSPAMLLPLPRVHCAEVTLTCHVMCPPFVQYCLFNITADPCEYTDLAKTMPEVVQDLKAKLAPFQATAVPPVQPEGCLPVQIPVGGDGGVAWQPCDAPHA